MKSLACSNLCVLCFLMMLTIAAPAQEYAQFHGTWFNAKFVEALKKSASMATAMDAVSSAEPLTIQFDSTDGNGNVVTQWTLKKTDTLLLRKTSIPGVGMKWALGTSDAPMWVASADEKLGTYVALTPIEGVDTAKPVVMGKLPSKNPNPSFILKRMVNSSYLSGEWKDKKGTKYSFTSGMVATFGADMFPYDISIDANTYSVTITSTSGVPRSYLVVRTGNSLVLTSVGGGKKRGKTLTLQKV